MDCNQISLGTTLQIDKMTFFLFWGLGANHSFYQKEHKNYDFWINGFYWKLTTLFFFGVT
jgi:hypothetical protein